MRKIGLLLEFHGPDQYLRIPLTSKYRYVPIPIPRDVVSPGLYSHVSPAELLLVP